MVRDPKIFGVKIKDPSAEHRMYHFFDLFGIGGGGVLDELVVVGGVIQLLVQPTFSVYIGPDIH